MIYAVLCALDGCNEPLPDLAVEHGDQFHSSRCARAASGVRFECDERDARHGLVGGLKPGTVRRKGVAPGTPC